jgi:mRNA interferase MazF
MSNFILRGELYYADLNPVVGSEQGGIRPVLIIQNDIGNKHSPTVIVAAITSKATKATLPTHCYLNPNIGLEQDSIALLEQIRTIDKQRLKDYIGTLDHSDILAINKALAISIGLNRRIL